jgi:cell wall assembly regulator SMI1
LKYLVIIVLGMTAIAFIVFRLIASPGSKSLEATKDHNIESSLELWLKRFDEKNIRMRDQLNSGATETDLLAFEKHIGNKLPEDVRSLYKIANGQKSPFYPIQDKGNFNFPFPIKDNEYVGNLFGSYEFLSLDQAKKEWENWKTIEDQSSKQEIADFDDNIQIRDTDPVKKKYAHSKWIPIAMDGGGNSYALDLDPEPSGKIGQIIVIGPDEDLRRVIAPGIKELFLINAAQAIGQDEGDDQRYFFDLVDP